MASSSVAISPPSKLDVRKMNKQALVDELASRGLDTNGLRPLLIQRLESSVKARAAAEALSTSTDETLKSSMETSQQETLAIVPQADVEDSARDSQSKTHTLNAHSGTLILNPQKDTLTSNLQENSEVQEPTTTSEEATAVDANSKASPLKVGIDQVKITPPLASENGKSELNSSTTTHLSDLEKKRLRAERFGVGLKVSEIEKLAIRAERFSGAEGKKGSSTREPESEKMKQRAARFGIVDDEGRKKARQERFAPASKQDVSVEVDKRKARAARFGAATEPVGSKE
eukprot:c19322_g1_i1 orf=217-1077(+)